MDNIEFQAAWDVVQGVVDSSGVDYDDHTGEVVAFLKKLRELLADPSHWTQGYWARNEHGMECYPDDPAAVCWCITGAMRKLRDEHCNSWGACMVAEMKLKDLVPNSRLVQWNDNMRRKHEHVLALIDNAIEALS